MTKPRTKGQRSTKLTPWPELLPGERGGEWDIHDSPTSHRTEMTDVEHKKMYVPTNPEHEVRNDEGVVYCTECNEEVNHNSSIRWHELLHAKFSPVGKVREHFTVNGIKHTPSQKYIHMAEEWRIDAIGYSTWTTKALVDPADDGSMYAPTCTTSLYDGITNMVRAGKYQDVVEVLFQYHSPAYASSGDRKPRRIAGGWVNTNIFSDNSILVNELIKMCKSMGLEITRYTAHAAISGDLKNAKWLVNKLLQTHTGQKQKIPFKIWARKPLGLMAFGQHLNQNWSNYSVPPYSDGYLHYIDNTKRLEKVNWSTVLKAAAVLEARFEGLARMQAKQQASLSELLEALDNEDDDQDRDTLERAVSSSGIQRAPSVYDKGSMNKFISATEDMSTAAKEQISAKAAKAQANLQKGDPSKEMDGLLRGKDDSINMRTGVSGPWFAPATYTTTGAEVEWAPMYMETAPLTRKYPVHKLQKAHARSSDEGSIPRNMHRYATDKRVFRTHKPVYGASVLIDDSGSMSFTLEQLEAIIDIAPASIVALYAGHSRFGMLRIVAKDGKRVGERTQINIRNMGGNEVDYPALVWLAHQPWPRIWITDGQVVSPSHGWSHEARRPCDEIVHEAGIYETLDPTMAELVIKGKVKAPRPTKREYIKTMKPRKRGLSI